MDFDALIISADCSGTYFPAIRKTQLEDENMNFLSIFDVIGPNMIGPSSSHTAGAVSMALLARKMCPEPIKKVTFTLYGSFAKTYHGHGTDRALLGGILGFSTDDARIRDAFELAKEFGVEYEYIIDEDMAIECLEILADTKGMKPEFRMKAKQALRKINP